MMKGQRIPFFAMMKYGWINLRAAPRCWIVDMMKDGGVQLVMNSTEGAQAVEDSKSIRSVALYDRIPYFTTAAGSHAAALAIRAQADGDVGVKSLQG